MAKPVARKKAKGKRGAGAAKRKPAQVPVHSLPPDVVYMIMDILKKDTESIRACSLSVRTFRPVAQSFLGRHISVKDPSPLKNCVKIVKNSGFQSIRSLSLGITTKRTVPEEYWNDYLTILKAFAERRSLLRLWLWEVPLSFLQPEQKEMFVEIVLALSTSVNDLGLYGCHFSCYEEMVSLVRAFPHCERLYLQDCVTGGRGSPTNVLAELPQHRLSIVDLDLTASSRNKRLIDTSGFIEDAELDLSSLGKLACDLRSARGIRRVVSAASKSPVRDARFSSARPEGFKAFFTSISPRWHLESLTIGPMYHEANTEFWKPALGDFPNLPHLTKIKVIYHYSTPNSFNPSFWYHLSHMLSHHGIFSHLKGFDVCPTIMSRRLGGTDLGFIRSAFPSSKLYRFDRWLTQWGGPYPDCQSPS